MTGKPFEPGRAKTGGRGKGPRTGRWKYVRIVAGLMPKEFEIIDSRRTDLPLHAFSLARVRRPSNSPPSFGHDSDSVECDRRPDCLRIGCPDAGYLVYEEDDGGDDESPAS